MHDFGLVRLMPSHNGWHKVVFRDGDGYRQVRFDSLADAERAVAQIKADKIPSGSRWKWL